MTICKCCGQEIREDAQIWQQAPTFTSHNTPHTANVPALAAEPIIEVDANLLEAINLAHGDAEADGSAHVEIAHLARRLLWSERDNLQNIETTIEDATWWITYMAPVRTKAPLSTADDLKTLLARAERRAKLRGVRYAAPTDALAVLFENSADLVTAEFLSAAPTEITEHQWLGLSEARRETSDAAFYISAANVNAPHDTAPHAPEGALQSAAHVEPYRPHGDFPEPAVLRDGHRTEEMGTTLPNGRHYALSPEIEYRLEKHDRTLALIQNQLAHLIEATDASARANAAREQASAQRLAAQQAASQRMSRNSLSQNTERTRQEGGATNDAQTASKGARSTGQHSKSLWQRSKRRPWASLRRKRRRMGFAELRSGQSQWPSGKPDLSIVRNVFDPQRGDLEPRPARPRQNRDADEATSREKRFYLAPGDDIVDAPSIGHKTAVLLNNVGLRTVRDLLNADANDVARRVDIRYVSAERVEAWKQQARLVCTIPWLRGTHAQLLVGAGYPTVHEIVAASSDNVTTAILNFAKTRDGQSVLRNNPPPNADRIREWLANATLAEPARAA